jgi:ParB-like chromosome segregation protein Spo0J
MSNFKVVNVVTSAVVVLETKNAVAEFIAAEGVTDNSVKTISKKINTAVKNNEVLYETFKIEEEDEMKQNEEVVYDAPETLENVNPEILQEAISETIEAVSDEPKLDADATAEAIVEEVIEQSEEQAEQEYLESDEAADEVEKENQDMADQIKNDMKDKDEEPKENKRKVGKGIVAYKNGEEYMTFPSIKACATHFKELLGLGHMPFTPIMKSVRQDVDWNEYSFKHEKDEDLHIPAALKAKLSQQEDAAKNAPTENEKEEMKETAEETADKDEVIEEIVEEEITDESKSEATA